MNEVTQCAGLVSTNAKSHQLRWGDREWVHYICCLALRCLLKLSSLLVAFYFLQGSPLPCNLQNKLPLLHMPNSTFAASHFTAMEIQWLCISNMESPARIQHACNRCMLCAMYCLAGSCDVCTNVLCVCIHEFQHTTITSLNAHHS